MTDENDVKDPGAGDEIPGIPVPDNDEIQGTPVPASEIPDEAQGEPVPEEPVYGTPLTDEEVYGAPAEARKPRVRGSMPWVRSGRWPMWVVIGCLLSCCLCCFLPLCILAVAGGGLAAVFENTETTDTQSQQFTINPAEPLTLSIEGTNGSIDIRRGDTDNEVSITYTRKAHGWTKSAAEKELERIGVDIQQPADSTITIQVDTEEQEDWFWSQTSAVDMTITVPEEAAITVNNNTGSITVADVRARALDLHSNTGRITFDGSLAPDAASSMEIQTNTGSISVGLPADTSVRISAETNTGSINVSDAFNQMTDVNESQDGAGEAWTGTLGDAAANSPTLRLFTNTGSVSVDVR